MEQPDYFYILLVIRKNISDSSSVGVISTESSDLENEQQVTYEIFNIKITISSSESGSLVENFKLNYIDSSILESRTIV